MAAKINLLLGDKNCIRSGYLNLDATLTEPEDVRLPCSINDFPSICPNEADEILALGVLEQLPPEICQPSVAYWVSCLAHKGRLTISVTDVEEVAHNILYGNESIDQVNAALYDGRRSAHTMQSLRGLVESLGMSVVHTFYQNTAAVIVCERP